MAIQTDLLLRENALVLAYTYNLCNYFYSIVNIVYGYKAMYLVLFHHSKLRIHFFQMVYFLK